MCVSWSSSNLWNEFLLNECPYKRNALLTRYVNLRSFLGSIGKLSSLIHKQCRRQSFFWEVHRYLYKNLTKRTCKLENVVSWWTFARGDSSSGSRGQASRNRWKISGAIPWRISRSAITQLSMMVEGTLPECDWLIRRVFLLRSCFTRRRSSLR